MEDEVKGNYKGKPENFDPNFRAKKRAEKKGGVKKDDKAGPPAHPKPGPPQMKAPPKARHAENAKPATAPKNDPLYKEAIFGIEADMREVALNSPFHVTLTNFPQICNQAYALMKAADKDFSKIMSKEMFAYYATALLWIKILNHRFANQGDITESEQRLYTLTAEKVYNIPEPLLIFFKSFGDFTTVTGENKKIFFPPLPSTVSNHRGGYFAEIIAEDNHYLFENLPCLGLAGDLLMSSLVPTNAPGTLPAVNIEVPPRTTANQNLLWVQPLSYRKPDTLSYVTDLGIAHNQFPETIPNTRLNLQLLDRLSVNMKQCKSFRITETQIIHLGMTGTIIQEIVTRAIPTDHTILCVQDEIAATSITRESTASVGASHLMSLQFSKSMAIDGDNDTENSLPWSCITFTAADPIPAQWVQNRNALLDLPPRYRDIVFRSIPVNGPLYRERILENLRTSSSS